MSKKISVDKDGKVSFEGKELQRKDIDNNFLNVLFQSALDGDVEFSIDDTDPIAKLFLRIQEETKTDAPFAKQIKALQSQKMKNNEEKMKIDKAEKEEDLS